MVGYNNGSTALSWALFFFLIFFFHFFFFFFIILYTVHRARWTGDQPITRPLRTHRSTQTFVFAVGFEPTTRAFEPAKTVHALGRADTVIASVLKKIVYVCRRVIFACCPILIAEAFITGS
jgi:hypothetical protein